MPTVGGKKYPYTKAGMAAAKKARASQFSGRKAAAMKKKKKTGKKKGY
tara:strand:- start:30 stop:173 length:144 start_codon:yes stop_codon:yes gene_type:complete